MNYYQIEENEIALYSAIFSVWKDKNAYIVGSIPIQVTFQDTITTLSCIKEQADRVEKKLKEIDPLCFFEIKRLLRHNREDVYQLAHLYLRMILTNKAPVRDQLANRVVFDVMSSLAQITRELDHLKGFLRFTENDQGILYAPFEPDHDILTILLPHFERRLGKTPFLIHDKKRGKIAIWNGISHTFATLSEDATYVPSLEEIEWQKRWKNYYDHVTIPLRLHEKQMKGSMPVRYWKYLPEKNENLR